MGDPLRDSGLDLSLYFQAQANAKWRRAECEAAGAKLELALREERMAMLLSQHEPLADLDVDRGQLRVLFSFLRHGDMDRLGRQLEAAGEG